jgi:monoamine oxidase
MKSLTRRSFITGSTALLAAPRIAAAAPAGGTDVIIVGAGAAGIAAARRVAAAGRRFTLLEARDHVGGRCITDARTFGVPFDRGAHWIRMPDVNPVTRLASSTGLDVYRAPFGQRVRIGRRYAREGELEDYLASIVRASRAIAEAARGRSDVSCAQALPHDLGDWRSTVEFVLGPYAFGSDLDQLSAVDVARSAERDIDAFCRQGFGALLAKLAEAVPVRRSTPVTRIDMSPRRGRIELTTPNGTLGADYAIVTVSTDVLAAEKIDFAPDLPKRHLDAARQLRLGSYDYIGIELDGNPLGLRRDDLVFEKSSGPQTAALLANVSDTSLAMVAVAGRFGRELSAKGERAMVEFAIEWLTGLFGPDLRGAVKRTAATNWNADPWTLGAMSAAVPGGQRARRVLMEPVRDRLFFAGEALHETLWGTVGGAWESGERAAEAVLRRMGALKPPPAERRRPPRQRRRQ